MTTTQCVKVAELRKIGYANLEEWIADEDNVYVGRRGRIFITENGEKRIFHYKQSKWANPYVVGDECTLEQSLRRYKRHLKKSGLIDDISELKGKVLGCFCDQKNDCHAKVLKNLLD